MVLPPTESGAASIDRTPAAASVTRSACPFAGRSASSAQAHHPALPDLLGAGAQLIDLVRRGERRARLVVGHMGDAELTGVGRELDQRGPIHPEELQHPAQPAADLLVDAIGQHADEVGGELADESLEPEPLVEGALRPRLPPRREHERHDQGALNEDDDAGINPGGEEGQHGPHGNRSDHPV